MKKTLTQSAVLFLMAIGLADCASKPIDIDMSQISEPFGHEWIHTNEGYDIRTTCDSVVQEAVRNIIAETLEQDSDLEGGTAVVMDVKTGAIRAMVNLKKTHEGTLTDEYDYAAKCAVEPGSTVMLPTLMALLDDGCVTLDSSVRVENNNRWTYKGAAFNDAVGHSATDMDLKTAFAESSNAAFSQLVVKYYEDAPEAYIEKLCSMGLGAKLDLEFGGDAPSMIPQVGSDIWMQYTLPMVAIGYNLLLTPLQILTFYNAVANNGKMMRPRLIEAYCRNGKTLQTFNPTVMNACICTHSTITDAQAALRAAVTEGMGTVCNDSVIHISGKTGYSQVAFKDGSKMVYRDSEGRKKHTASFVGYFPSEDPQYSCIVVLYSAKIKEDFYGLAGATHAFKDITDSIYRLRMSSK